MYRRFLVSIFVFIMLLAFSGLTVAQQSSNPTVTAFSSSLKSVDPYSPQQSHGPHSSVLGSSESPDPGKPSL